MIGLSNGKDRLAASVALAALVAGLAGVPAWGQEKAPAPATPTATTENADSHFLAYPPSYVQRVFQLKNADPVSVFEALKIFSGVQRFDRRMNLVMWAGPKELAPAVEDVVRRLDTPQGPAPSVELTFYVLRGSRQSATAEALPAGLERVATQLRGAFGLAQLALLDTAFLRARAGSRAATDGLVHGLGDPAHPATYSLSMEPVSVAAADEGKVIRLAHLGFRLVVTVTTGTGGAERVEKYADELHTDVEFREGQKAVVGRTSAAGPGESLFLVVSGKVIE